MRTVTMIVVHCTATRREASVEALREGFRRRGWKNPGYHFVVGADGEVTQLQDVARIANGVRNHNAHAVHVAYIGGIDAEGRACDTRTGAQRAVLAALVERLKGEFPRSVVLGHRDLSPDLNHDGRVSPDEWVKQCPCFDAVNEYN